MGKISQKTTKKPRGIGRRFQPGQSGNPKGRPPLTLEQKEFRELCKQEGPGALERLKRIARGRGMTSYLANTYLIDRGYGRPKQEVEIAGPGGGPVQVQNTIDVRKLSDDQLKQLDALLARAESPQPDGDSGGAGPAPAG